MHNQQVNMTVGVYLAQYHKLWLLDALENKVACNLVAYQDMVIGCENGDSRVARVEIY